MPPRAGPALRAPPARHTYPLPEQAHVREAALEAALALLASSSGASGAAPACAPLLPRVVDLLHDDDEDVSAIAGKVRASDPSVEPRAAHARGGGLACSLARPTRAAPPHPRARRRTRRRLGT